jgi:hypothetical protein
VIPDLVGTLAESAGIGPLDVTSRKGSYWALFFGDGASESPALLRADYYDDAVDRES